MAKRIAKSDGEFYAEKSWGSQAIKESKDLPTLKVRYLFELLKQRTKKEATLLEVGCGSGRILASIKARDKHLKLTGLDISPEQIKIAKRDNKGITFVAGDGEKLPFKDKSFDYVVFLDYIEHVDHPDKALKELARVLKPGGYFYGVSPCEEHGIYWLSRKILGRHIKEKTAGHIQRYTIKGLVKRVEKQGLEVTNCKYSYHLLGSLMDYTLFALMLHPKVAKMWWEQNNYYQTKKKKATGVGRAYNGVLKLGNVLAYTESTIFKNTRCCATAVHITACKR